MEGQKQGGPKRWCGGLEAEPTGVELYGRNCERDVLSVTVQCVTNLIDSIAPTPNVSQVECEPGSFQIQGQASGSQDGVLATCLMP